MEWDTKNAHSIEMYQEDECKVLSFSLSEVLYNYRKLKDLIIEVK